MPSGPSHRHSPARRQGRARRGRAAWRPGLVESRVAGAQPLGSARFALMGEPRRLSRGAVREDRRPWTSPSSSSAPPARCRPSSARPASLLVRRGGDRMLIDCGEGTQRQLLRSVGLPDVEHVFLTHFHADHFLGLPGHAEDVRAAGPRRAADRLRAAAACAALMSRPAAGVRASSPTTCACSELAPERRRRDGRLRGSAPTPPCTGSRRSATRWSRTSGPGRFDPASRARARRARRARSSAASSAASRSRPAGGVVAPRDVMGDAAARAHAGVHRRHRALRGDGRRRAGGRPARPRRHLRRRGDRARAPDRPLDRPPGRRGGASGRTSPCSRSRICPRATSPRRSRRRRARCSSARWSRATST